MLDFTIRIGSTPTFLDLDLDLSKILDGESIISDEPVFSLIFFFLILDVLLDVFFFQPKSA